MATGRIRRSARRGFAVAILGWLAVAAASVLMAPSAGAAPTATVEIRDLTPPVVSVDAGGTVTFVNRIQDKTVQVGGGGLLPSLVTVTAKTEVTLRLPSGAKPLAPGASASERFDRSCATCSITYTYRLSSGASLTQPLIDAATGLLPPLPAPTPFVVNTIVPDLPNLPSVNVPQLPAVTVPQLPLPGTNAPVPAPNGEVPLPGGTTGTPTTPDGGTTPVQGVDGTQYTYDTGAGSPQFSAGNAAAAAAFDPARFYVPGQSLGGIDRASSQGSGGQAGSYDGASVPVFGQLAGLDTAALAEESADTATADRAASGGQTLPAAALAAVVALAAVTAALIRTHQAQRAGR
jgi:hypothetical protein